MLASRDKYMGEHEDVSVSLAGSCGIGINIRVVARWNIDAGIGDCSRCVVRRKSDDCICGPDLRWNTDGCTRFLVSCSNGKDSRGLVARWGNSDSIELLPILGSCPVECLWGRGETSSDVFSFCPVECRWARDEVSSDMCSSYFCISISILSGMCVSASILKVGGRVFSVIAESRKFPWFMKSKLRRCISRALDLDTLFFMTNVSEEPGALSKLSFMRVVN